MRIAVCGNNTIDQERLCKMLADEFGSTEPQSDIIKFQSGIELLSYIQDNGSIDILFIDTDMKGLNGIETAKELRRYDSGVLIVFLAATQDYAVASYSVDALNYMLKPVLKSDLSAVIKKAVGRLQLADNKRLCIKSSMGLYIILYRNIIYLQSTGHKISVITADMPEFMVYGKLDAYESSLENDSRFIRIHKSTLVNADYISYFGTDAVLLSDRTELTVSRALRGSARQRYLTHLNLSGASAPANDDVFVETL